MFELRVRELRKAKGLTQGELAEIVGIKARQFRNLEAGTSYPSYLTLIALADYFDVSIDYLVGRSDVAERR